LWLEGREGSGPRQGGNAKAALEYRIIPL